MERVHIFPLAFLLFLFALCFSFLSLTLFLMLCYCFSIWSRSLFSSQYLPDLVYQSLLLKKYIYNLHILYIATIVSYYR